MASLLRLPGRPGRVEEREVEEEIRLHLELRAAQLEAEGMGKEEARAEALRRFGPLDDARRTLRRASGFSPPTRILSTANWWTRCRGRERT